jgi:DNA-binding MarR family transcriptional regulator
VRRECWSASLTWSGLVSKLFPMSRLKHPELVGLVLETIEKILHAEKGEYLEAEGVKLHPSEIHLLLFLSDLPDARGVDMARRFSVTKGAISQTVSRLVQKGVLLKGKDLGGHGELDLSFTELGRTLLERLVRLRQEAERHYDQHLDTAGEAGRESIRSFLASLQERFPAEP